MNFEGKKKFPKKKLRFLSTYSVYECKRKGRDRENISQFQKFQSCPY